MNLNATAINNFREYLRIPSVHPNINYEPCVEFIKKVANELELPTKVIHCVPKKPIIVLTWVGQQPNLPSILLTSHMDVVPVFEENWTHPPFAADLDEQGKIFGRGAQDMKCVAIQYLEAIRRLKLQKVSLLRTIHISFLPDEEISGIDGMKKFVHTEEFRNLNIGFSLDEGLASPNEDFVLFHGERCIWYMHIHFNGTPGHGSLLSDNTPGEKLSYVLNKFMEFRTNEKRKLKENPSLTIGDVTTVNLTQIYGGVQNNVIPAKMTLGFDVRLPVTLDVKKFEETVIEWCNEAGEEIEINCEQKQPQIPATTIDDTNVYWAAFKTATDKLGLTIKPQIFPGGTDSRYIRGVGLPAIGFSPMNNTPVLLHANDEYLNVDVFLKGINIYREIITSLANVPDITG